MKYILVLCGDGRMVNGRPFVTLHHPDGKIVAEKTIEGIFPEEYDKILYAIAEDAEEKYSVGTQIRKTVGMHYPVEIVTVKDTSGPAETAYQAIQNAGIEGELVIKDSSNHIKLSAKPNGNFIAVLNLLRYERSIDGLRNKSFVRLNEQGQVMDIVEKRFRSDVISCGLYSFRHASDVVRAYERLNDPAYPIGKLYISHIISYLIGYSNQVFHTADILEFEDWKTPHAWAYTQRRQGLCFLDMDNMGTTTIPFEDSVMDWLRKISKDGGRFVGCAKGKVYDANAILAYMRNNGVHILGIIQECGYSEVRRVVDSKKTLEEIALEEV